MKITKRQLKRIIKEEKDKLREQPQSPGERLLGENLGRAPSNGRPALDQGQVSW